MTTLRFVKQLPGNKRTQIVAAVHRIIERYYNGETYTSIYMPPRFGKSSVMRLSALESNAITKMPTIMTAPWIDNVDQIVDLEKIKEMYLAYGIELSTPFLTHRVKHLSTHQWWKLESGIPTFVSCTIGLINNAANQKQFLDGITDIYQRSGKRVPVFVDECHLCKDIKPWGQFLEAIVAAGGYVVVLTGTPVPGVPGFIEEFSEWEEVVRKNLRKEVVDDRLKYFLDTKEGERRKLRKISADYSVIWKDAWDVGALAKVNAIWIDMDVKDEKTKQSIGKLSKLSTADLNGRLRKVMESPELMTLQVNAGLHRLMQLRSKEKTKTAQMLITTGSDIRFDDQEAESNRHAKAYKKLVDWQMAVMGITLRVAIATGAVDKASNIVKEFRKGFHDVLIVKNMGLVGLDAPACKVQIFGSSLRNGALAVQALSRTLTTWGTCPASLILSKDCKMVELYDRLIKDQGGEHHESKLRLIDSVEVEPPDEKPVWDFDGPVVDSYSDHDGNQAKGDYEAILELIKIKYHTNGLTDLQIIENIKLGGFPVNDAERNELLSEQEQLRTSGIQNLDEGLEDVEGEFGKKARGIVIKHIGSYYENKELWLQKVEELQAIAKKLCGVRQKLKDIDDVVLLKRLIDALDVAEQQVFGHDEAQRSV